MIPPPEKKATVRQVLFLLAICFFLSHHVHAQQLAEDTVTFLFQPSSTGDHAPCVARITDSRNVPEAWISTFSKRKLLLIPVDVLYCNREPMAQSLQKGFPFASEDSSCYYLDIHDLSISYRGGILFPAFVLSSVIPVYQGDEDSLVLSGSLVYNNDYKKLKKEKFSAACPRILYEWYPQFQEDLSDISRGQEAGSTSGERVYWMEGVIPPEERMHLAVSGTIGPDWWQAEAEIWFTGVETCRKWVYTTSILRYQNHREFESIAFGKRIEHLRYRLNSLVSYDASFSLLIGINKWKNLREMKPTLYQIPQLNLSTVQSVVLAASNRRGLFIRAGVQGNLYYIYDKKPGFQAGLYLGAGYAY